MLISKLFLFMKKIIFLASIVQCIGATQASLSSFSIERQDILHRPIDVSASQNKLTRYLPIEGTDQIAAIRDVSSNGDCLLYSLGITDAEHSTRSSESPGDTTNRASVLLYLLRNINSMSDQTLYRLSLAMYEQFQDLDQYKAQLTLCYPNNEDFCLAMAFRLNRLNVLVSLFENEHNAELFQILGAPRKNINSELIGNKPLRDRSVELLHTALNSHSSSELLDFFTQKIKDTFNMLSQFPERGFSSENEKLVWINFLKNGLYVLGSTRIYLSASLCVFLAPMLDKNIQIWRELGSSITGNSNLKHFRFYGRNQEEAQLSPSEALTYLADPNTYNISLRGDHYQVVTTLKETASLEGSPEMTKARNCINQMEFTRDDGSSLTEEQLASMPEEQQLAHAMGKSLKLSDSDKKPSAQVNSIELKQLELLRNNLAQIEQINASLDQATMRLHPHHYDAQIKGWTNQLWDIFMSMNPQNVPTAEAVEQKILQATVNNPMVDELNFTALITDRYNSLKSADFADAQNKLQQIVSWSIENMDKSDEIDTRYKIWVQNLIPYPGSTNSAMYNTFLISALGYIQSMLDQQFYTK